MHQRTFTGMLIAMALLAALPRGGLAQAPCRDCDCIMQRAGIAADAGDFQLALRQYDAAKLCDTALTDSVNRAIVDLFLRIDKLRVEAVEKEIEAKAAVLAMQVAQQGMEEAQDSLALALADAEMARRNAETAQAAAEASERKASEQARIAQARLTVNEINALLLDKRHQEALERIAIAGKDSLGAAGDTIVTNTIENFRNAGLPLLWRRDASELKKFQQVYLSHWLAVVAIDSAGRAYWVSNSGGRAVPAFDTTMYYRGGAFSKSGRQLALYGDRAVHLWDVEITEDTTATTYPYVFSNRKVYRSKREDLMGVCFSDDDFLYVLDERTVFSFSKPNLPIYTSPGKIVGLESSILLPEQGSVKETVRGRKLIITMEKEGPAGKVGLEKKLILFKKATSRRSKTYVRPIEVRYYQGGPVSVPRRLVFGPNQQFLISEEGAYIDLRGRVMAQIMDTNTYGSPSVAASGKRALRYYSRMEKMQADDIRVWPAIERIAFVRGNELTVRTLDGWEEMSFAHPGEKPIQGVARIPKESGLDPWLMAKEEAPDNFYILTYTDKDILVWDWKTGVLITKATVTSGRIRDVAVSVGGRYLQLTTDEGRLELWQFDMHENIKDRIIGAVSENRVTPQNK